MNKVAKDESLLLVNMLQKVAPSTMTKPKEQEMDVPENLLVQSAMARDNVVIFPQNSEGEKSHAS
jgi:hypothetical protein